MEIRLDTGKSLWENVQVLHERLKKLKKKRERLLKLIEEEKHKKGKETTQEKHIEVRKKRKREWYESFRWMFTSGGYLVLGGRDARTNEVLVRKHLGEGDLFFHADVVGAPAVIMKGGKDAPENDVREAATFAAVYSRAWKMGLFRVPVFFVDSSQVSLSPPAGEYRPRGGIIIRGKRNWLEVENKIYLGFDGDRFFVSAVPTKNTVYELLPGGEGREEVADRIIKDLGLDKSMKSELVPLLPPGEIEVRRLGTGFKRQPLT